MVEEAVTYKYDTSIGKTVMRSVSEFITSTLKDLSMNMMTPSKLAGTAIDIAMDNILGDDVGTYGKRLLDLVDANNIKPGNALSEDFINSYRNISDGIGAYNKYF